MVNSGSDKLYVRGIERTLRERHISFDFLDPTDTDFIRRVRAYDAFIWHFSHSEATDYLIAKPIISALEASGMVVFPPTSDTWHFDDKLAQKYLFDALDFEAPATEVYTEMNSALAALASINGPVVMKLRSGASSANVRLIVNNATGRRLVRKAFRRGFRQFDRVTMARDAWKAFSVSKLSSLVNALKETAKIFVKSRYEKVRGLEKNYVLFQEFLPANPFDVRLVVINQKIFGMRRFNRPNDFRASGSGFFDYSPEHISVSCVQLAIESATRLRSRAVAFDFIFDGANPKIVEISYGINVQGYRDCEGFWDFDGAWHQSPWPQGDFQFENFIVDSIMRDIDSRNKFKSAEEI